MSKWRFGDVLKHTDDRYVVRLMFVTEDVAFVIYDEDVDLGDGISAAWPVGTTRPTMRVLDHWVKVEDGP